MRKSKVHLKSLSFCHYCDWIWKCESGRERCKVYKEFAKSKPSKVKMRREVRQFDGMYD